MWTTPVTSRISSRSRDDGFTIVELLLSLSLFGLLLGSMSAILFSSQRLAAAEELEYRLNDSMRRTARQISEELRGAYAPSLLTSTPPSGGVSLSFQRVVGHDGADVVLGAVQTFTYVAPQSGGFGTISLDDGVQTRVVGGNVLGLQFTSVTNGIELLLTVGENDRWENLIQRSVTRRTTCRN